MNCKDVKGSLLSYLDGEVSPEEQKAIQAHLSACPHCRDEVEALADTQTKLRQAFKTMAARVSPSPQAWATIKQRLMRGERHKISTLSLVKSRVRGMVEGLKAPRPAWQTTLVSALSIALIIALCLTTPLLLHQPTEEAQQAQFKRFSSYEEMEAFVEGKHGTYYTLDQWSTLTTKGNLLVSNLLGGEDIALAPVQDYSVTNIQVEGVDEADIVKSDGEFLYLVSDKRVIIVKAYPPEETRVLSTIELDDKPEGIFINGNKLVVLYQNWNEVVRNETENKSSLPNQESAFQTFIKIYDISNRESPSLKRDVSVDGQYFDSRMVGNYIYVVINDPVYRPDGRVGLPGICADDKVIEIPATNIYYSDASDNIYAFTTIVAINTEKDNQEPAYETILLGTTSNMYVSLNNIYITFPAEWGSDLEKTTIHRIHIEDGEIKYDASGEVPGRVLNQFSMDEYQGYFRIATTTGNVARSWQEATSQNNLYILDTNLDVVARLEGLAPGESIYSARFMANRCYLVTFEKIDPLFVIDLKNPYHPKVLGQLKISGYSDYLQPYDENYLLGIGKETIAAEEGDFAWYQGVKISLFDVSDVENPKEIAKYEIGDRGTDSPVLSDHKALLFDKAKNLLVIPVLVAEVNDEKYPDGAPPYAYGDYVWQGAYVFEISIDGGLQLKGRITHYDDPSQVGNYYYGANSVQRSLYIDNVLYTISETKIKMNSLEDLSEINELVLP